MNSDSLNAIVNSPNNGVKLIFFLHFILVTWSIQYNFIPNSYLFYNTFLLVTLLWALAHKDQMEEPLFFAMSINAISILFDILVIGSYYTSMSNGFSTLTIILNLILRPCTTILLIRYYNDRSDSTINIPGITCPAETSLGNGRSNARSSYESIDRPNAGSLA